MTNESITKLLGDLIHFIVSVDARLTQMEANMAVVYSGIEDALAVLNTAVAGVSSAVAALPAAGAAAPSIDEAAIQAKLDSYMNQVKALTDQLNADVAKLTAPPAAVDPTVPPAPAV